MGRKIPGKKHRGIKDPEQQQAKRLAEILPKINAPPKNIDDQDIPKSLERVIKLKNAVKNNSLIQKKKGKRKKGSQKLIKIGASSTKPLHPKAKPEKAVPLFHQRPGESNHQFWFRVQRETQNFVKETEFETKFNVQVKRNHETGDVEGIEKLKKDELDKLMAKHRNVNKKKKIKRGEEIKKLSKSQKRKEKLLKKKQKKDEDDTDEFKVYKDKVEFGDIVHAPPDLKVLPKLASKTDPDKVKSKSLLLSSFFKPSNEEPQQSNKSKILINRSGKRKNLPMGERRQLEKQQSDVIAAYRSLKAEKFKT